MPESDADRSTCRITLEAAAKRLPTPAGERSASVFAHGSLDVKLYAPRGEDTQTAHARDEVYVVARGSGWFSCGGKRQRFGPLDVLFVAAGAAHRFEEFSADFATWVFFYGANGGEGA